MKLTTPIKIPKSPIELTHNQAITLMGSCFSQNIGNKLAYHKFKTNLNSFGTVFNPVSIANNLTRLVNQQLYTEKDFYNVEGKKLVNFNNQYSSFNTEINNILKTENESLTKDIEHFKASKTLIITFGTAWVYEFNKTQQIVANCHKIPSINFTKRLLSVKEIIAAYQPIIAQLKHLNIIFTVSPVRHSKDGLHENNLSKSTLHLAINNLVEQHQNCFYFPAYEIVIDELRDYRFYKDDLVHPTNLAVNYVWDKFSETYFNKETLQLIEKIIKVNSAVTHKPFNYNSEEHQLFIKNQLSAINQLKKEHTFLDFSYEISQLKQQKLRQ